MPDANNPGTPAAPPATPAGLRAWDRTTTVAALLCGLAVLVLLAFHLGARANDPVHSPELATLKQNLIDEPKNETLKQRIRDLDLSLRQRHARHLAIHHFGSWFLLASGVLLAVSAKSAARLRAALPLPQSGTDAAAKATLIARQARATTAGVGLALFALFLLLAWPSRTQLPSGPDGVGKLLASLRGDSPQAALTLPSPAEYAANWPRFLGPHGNAWVSKGTIPHPFDLASNEGVLWKTPLTVPGFNSPIVWSNRVYMSGGDATNRSVFCYDLETGAPVWQRAVANVPGAPSKPPEIPESTGFAAPTMATDGLRVYVMFATGDVAAFALDGRPVWSKNLGVPDNPYGHATSLATQAGLLIVQLDQATEDDNRSKLIALDGATGKTAWETPRPVGASWATPAVAAVADQPHVLTLGGELIMAYNGATGAEVWRAKLIGGEVTPSPGFVQGFWLVASPSDTLYAIRPDGTGDVAKSHVAWKTDENIPDVTSPVSNGNLVFTVLSHGVVTCHDFKDGKKLWEHEADTEVHASPALVGDTLCVLGAHGRVLLMNTGREARELARLELGEEIFASPALAHDRMIIRTTKHLFAVSTAPAPTPGPKQP